MVKSEDYISHMTNSPHSELPNFKIVKAISKQSFQQRKNNNCTARMFCGLTPWTGETHRFADIL